MALVIKASDGEGGQSEGVIELAGGVGLCTGLSFSSRAVAALSLTLKVQENAEVSSCVCVCDCTVWAYALRNGHVSSLLEDKERWSFG